MGTNKEVFSNGEADAWFDRNRGALEEMPVDPALALALDWLVPFKKNISSCLEIGCGAGNRLHTLCAGLETSGVGVEPSESAVAHAAKVFPELDFYVGFGDDVPLEKPFNLVYLGFFLYLVDRSLYLRCISEADRLLTDGGYLLLLDFDTPFLYANDYKHAAGVKSFKMDNSQSFVGSGLYTLVNKFSFSHNNFYFEEVVDERLSLMLLKKNLGVVSNPFS